MATTQPIKNKKELQKFINYYQTQKPNTRNYTLIVIGLYTALRISDILMLTWKDLYDFEKDCFYSHLFLNEKKTGKASLIALNDHIKDALSSYKAERKPNPEEYIFSSSTHPDTPICRSQAYRIIKKAANDTVYETHISCHSLRKTFGYHAWKQGISPVLLMDIYNHSSFHITKRYLGISQDERDSIFTDINF